MLLLRSLGDYHIGCWWLGWRHTWRGSGSGDEGLVCGRLGSGDRGSCSTCWLVGIREWGWAWWIWSSVRVVKIDEAEYLVVAQSVLSLLGN